MKDDSIGSDYLVESDLDDVLNEIRKAQTEFLKNNYSGALLNIREAIDLLETVQMNIEDFQYEQGNEEE